MSSTYLRTSTCLPALCKQASENGYYSSFVPARGTAGRPSGGPAIPRKQAVPRQRMEDGGWTPLGSWEVGSLYPAL
eukprot:3688853-Amphidinium_carterae.1